jgi:hypothetical protein
VAGFGPHLKPSRLIQTSFHFDQVTQYNGYARNLENCFAVCYGPARRRRIMTFNVHRMLLGLAMLLALPIAAWGGCFEGQLWLVSNSGLEATFPVPTATPDATFTACHLSFFMMSPYDGAGYLPEVHNTVAGFLNSAHKVYDLAFSGLFNDVVGAVVGPTTPVVNDTATSDGTYGVYIEFTGTVLLHKNESVIITHDDGVSLMIDGELAPGFISGGTSAVAQWVQFMGTTGNHTIDLVYVNVLGTGLLSFGPKM